MRAVVQRALCASVTVEGREVSRIGSGLVVLVGICCDDGAPDADYVAQKVSNLRVFPDADGKMNRSLLDTHGEALLVSQFTLYGDARGGRRPSYSAAAPGEVALGLFGAVVQRLESVGISVSVGEFGADMQVSLVNDGPVTLLLDSRREF